MSLVLLAAGSSSRFKLPVKKQWLRVGNDPLWRFVTKRLETMANFETIIITAHADELRLMEYFADYTYVCGGKSRQESLKNALARVKTPYVLVSDIARACINEAHLHRIIAQKGKADCIVPFIKPNDTIVYQEGAIDREEVRLIQTPQLSRTEVLKKAIESQIIYTDESSAIKAAGGTVVFVEGSQEAKKITTALDLKDILCLAPPSQDYFTGTGLDVHPFEEKKRMVLGGVPIDAPFGFAGHSDGDVAIHALIDALMGAAGIGDIGELFPDTDNAYKNIDSKILLDRTAKLLVSLGYKIVSADITIAAQTPRLSPYKLAMRKTLAKILGLDLERMNIKATTTEKLGFIGRKEGVAVYASATLKFFDWTQPFDPRTNG